LSAVPSRRRPHAAPRDAGLQAERTALAWSRTSLAVLANAALALRAGWVGDHPAVVALGLGLVGAALAVFVLGLHRRDELLAEATVSAPAPRQLLAVTGTALASCATGLWVIALHAAGA
jgi:uncharacterized membrane protein YidH (DUF202 family)